jgi:hypothetical protein
MSMELRSTQSGLLAALKMPLLPAASRFSSEALATHVIKLSFAVTDGFVALPRGAPAATRPPEPVG